nr:GTP pyrophosphokinase [Raoultella sp. NCTC 9187]
MVEILSTLSMDIDTLRAAMLFPLADGEVVSEEVMQESVGKSVVTLIHGVRDMAAIRQLKATHTDSVSSEQVDNIRRMLLAMVDDFRCVVIKLAELSPTYGKSKTSLKMSVYWRQKSAPISTPRWPTA